MSDGGYFAGPCPECGTDIYVRIEFLTLKPVLMAYTCPACDAFILDK